MPCQNCKFSEAPRDNKGQVVLGSDVRVCKRMPPQTLVIPTPQGLALNTVWPTVPNMQYCGCYEPNGATEIDLSSLRGTAQ